MSILEAIFGAVFVNAIFGRPLLHPPYRPPPWRKPGIYWTRTGGKTWRVEVVR